MRRGLINHLDLTVSDLAVSCAFYDKVLGKVGYTRARQYAGGIRLHARLLLRLEHAVELSRRIPGTRLLTLPGGHGDYLGEAVMMQGDSRYPALTVALVEAFLASP